MFDLFRSRAKIVRYLLGGLLMVVALSMVVTLIPGFGSGGPTQDLIVAEVGKEAISIREVQQRLQMAMRNRSIPREMAQIYVPQLVDSLVTERAMVYEAQRLGFDVTPDDVARGLRMLAPMLFQNGQFVGKEAYAAILRDQNLTIPEFEESVRRQMMATKLADLMNQGVVVTPDEVARTFQSRNEKVKLEYIAVTPAKYRSEVTVTPEEIRAYYQAHKAQYQIPEKRALQLLVVDEAKVGERITVPDAELRKLYDANKDQFRTPDRVHVRHILLKTTDKPKDEIPKIRARAEELLKQLKAGADFAELAKKNSEDVGSAVKGGDIGWIVKGQTVANFESAAFSLKPKELSGVITTEYGFHILQVLEKEDARVKPFEEVKDQLAKERKKQQVYDTMQRLADQAHDLLVKSPAAGEQIARQLGIELVKVDKAGAGDPVPEFGVNQDFEATVTGLPKGGVTPVMQAPGNKLVVTVVTDVFPARPAELAEAEGQIRAALTTQKLGQLVDQRAREVLDKVKAAGGDLKKVAQAMGLEVKSTQEFSRAGAADGIGPATVVYQAFDLAAGSVFGPVTSEDGRFVCKVAAKIPADMNQLASQRSEIAGMLKADKTRERTALFEDSLKAALIKEGKIKIHQQVISRLLDSYGS